MSGRLVLGTVQLGLEYGVNNRSGKPSMQVAEGIISAALKHGVELFDTAQAYGSSEEVLGSVLKKIGMVSRAKVITKISPSVDLADSEVFIGSVQNSLKRLGTGVLHGLMLHNEEHLDLWDQGLGSNMERVKRQGLACGIGVSVYSPVRALAALGKVEVDFIQVPSSIVDRRFERAGVFCKAAELGKEVHVRSVFLQGLLLMSLANLPARLGFAADIISRMEGLARNYGYTPAELAFGFAVSRWPDARIVVGAESVEQVIDNARMAGMKLSRELCDLADKIFFEVDELILNPALWPRTEHETGK